MFNNYHSSSINQRFGRCQKSSFINQTLGWWNSEEILIPACSTTLIFLKIWEVGANPTTHLMQVYQLQVQQMKFAPPEQWMPLLVQCKSNNYNCKSHNCKSLHAPQLSFIFYQPNIWEVELGQRRKGFMLKIQNKKLTKNSFLVGSFLTCWLVGPFCRNLLLSTKDLDDETQ